MHLRKRTIRRSRTGTGSRLRLYTTRIPCSPADCFTCFTFPGIDGVIDAVTSVIMSETYAGYKGMLEKDILIMKLYTTTGDNGHTSLVDGSRVLKDDLRVVAAGEVDALNSLLGWCRAGPGAEPLASMIEQIQHELFHLGAELATPVGSRQILRITLLGAEQSRRLETWIDEASAAVPSLFHFVLPGGTELACRLHIARTGCRALERAVVTMSKTYDTRSEILVYINRLGDLLFAWARLANYQAHLPDPVWDPQR